MSEWAVILPVRMSREQREKLVQFAKDNDTNAADLIRTVLNDYMEAQGVPLNASVDKRGGDRKSKAAKQSKTA